MEQQMMTGGNTGTGLPGTGQPGGGIGQPGGGIGQPGGGIGQPPGGNGGSTPIPPPGATPPQQ
jgi:hypothetical protein